MNHVIPDPRTKTKPVVQEPQPDPETVENASLTQVVKNWAIVNFPEFARDDIRPKFLWSREDVTHYRINWYRGWETISNTRFVRVQVTKDGEGPRISDITVEEPKRYRSAFS